jgi:hypothetical protein
MPGKRVFMLLFDIDAILNDLIHGLIGILLIYGFTNVPAKPETEVDRLLLENKKLKGKNKHLFGFGRNVENVNTFLCQALQRSRDRDTESQLARERLNGELVRRGNQIRSLEFALSQERNKVKGRR